jgi:hypothetical protein
MTFERNNLMPQQEPSDTRITQMRSALKEARDYATDLLDDIPADEWPARHYLQRVRAFSNAALKNAERVS